MLGTGRLPALALAASLMTAPAHAGLIGTRVTGSNELNLIPINVFDPAQGMVPPGYLNDSGTTVTVSGSAIEFGAQNSRNLFTADFTSDQLIVAESPPRRSEGRHSS